MLSKNLLYYNILIITLFLSLSCLRTDFAPFEYKPAMHLQALDNLQLIEAEENSIIFEVKPKTVILGDMYLRLEAKYKYMTVNTDGVKFTRENYKEMQYFKVTINNNDFINTHPSDILVTFSYC